MLSVFVAFVAITTGTFNIQDPFDYPDGTEGEPRWFAESVAWEVRGGALTCSTNSRTFTIIEQAPHGKEVSIEAEMTLSERLGEDWAIAGVSVRRDGANFWHLALVEAPTPAGGGHFIELAEMLDNAWLSQSAESTRLTVLDYQGGGFDWQYAKPYILRIEMTPDRIDGYVEEREGTSRVQRAHMAFAFDNRAVTAGQPALTCGGFSCAFDNAVARVDQEVPPPEPQTTEYPEYAGTGYSGITATASGFFYTKQINKKSWLIDPKGQGFYMVGADHANYRVHWCEQLGYAPYARNVEAKYGTEEKWAESTAQRLADWGFNTLPAGHSASLRYRRFPHIEFLSMGSAFSGIDDICPKTTWTGFPNVFSPKWPRHCDKIARQMCATSKSDPWLIGYFLDNELEWFGKDYAPWGLFNEAWKKPASHTAKQAWIRFLKDQLGSPTAFTENWGVSITSFDDLAQNTTPSAPRTTRAKAVACEWVRKLAEAYFKTTCEAIRRYDPNHLILGCRFAGDAPDVWDIAGKHCDVVSFNMYPRIDVDRGVPADVVDTIQDWREKTRKPMMITEWSFPALDSGLPCAHGAGMRVDTQAQRTRCFQYFQNLMFSLPFMVGSNFFMWVDEPALGISSTFPEDSNYGLVNEQDEPYPDLTNMARDLNPRVYEVHSAGVLPDPPKPWQLVPWLTDMPATVTPIVTPITLTAGQLTIEGPVNGHAWRLKLGDKNLGDFFAVAQQLVAQNQWVSSNSTRITKNVEDEHVTVVEMELSFIGDGSVLTENSPRPYTTGWRFWIPRDGNEWLASQCLWIQNDADETMFPSSPEKRDSAGCNGDSEETSPAAWRLVSLYHYFLPAIGGNSASDEPLQAGVPNYYRSGAAWVDKTEGLGIGCWYPDDTAFSAYYWKDPGGGFHPDLSQEVKVLLKPHCRHTLNGAIAFFFPLRDLSLTGFGAASDSLRHAVTEEN